MFQEIVQKNLQPRDRQAPHPLGAARNYVYKACLSYGLSHERQTTPGPELRKVANSLEDQGERLVVPTGFEPVSEP